MPPSLLNAFYNIRVLTLFLIAAPYLQQLPRSPKVNRCSSTVMHIVMCIVINRKVTGSVSTRPQEENQQKMSLFKPFNLVSLLLIMYHIKCFMEKQPLHLGHNPSQLSNGPMDHWTR